MSYRAEALEAEGFDDSADLDAGKFGLKRLRRIGRGIARRGMKIGRGVSRGALKVGKVGLKVGRASLRVANKLASNPVLATALTVAYPPAGVAIAAIKAANTAEERITAIANGAPVLKIAAQYMKEQAKARAGVRGLDDAGALPLRVVKVRPRSLSKQGFAVLLRRAPAAAKLSRQILAFAAAPEASGFYDASGLSGQKWLVEAGDNLSQIALKLVGNANRWREMRDVNKQKPIDASTGNFKTLNPGELLNIPPTWWVEIVKRFPGTGPATTATPTGVPTGTDMGLPSVPVTPAGYPPMPGSGGGEFARGTILQVQMLLKGWGTDQPSQISPTDFGASVADFTGVWDTRTSRACASYQTWSNAKAGGKLRVDGQLDQPTYDSLVVYASTHIGGYTPPTPSTPAIPPAVPYTPPPSTPPSTPTTPVIPGYPAPKPGGTGPEIVVPGLPAIPLPTIPPVIPGGTGPIPPPNPVPYTPPTPGTPGASTASSGDSGGGVMPLIGIGLLLSRLL